MGNLMTDHFKIKKQLRLRDRVRQTLSDVEVYCHSYLIHIPTQT